MRKHLRQYAALARPMKDPPCFKCPLCPKAYSSAIRLDQHKQSHTGELDCPFCEKTFKWKHSLVEHIRAHNGKMYFIDAIKAFMCFIMSSYVQQAILIAVLDLLWVTSDCQLSSYIILPFTQIKLPSSQKAIICWHQQELFTSR